MDSEQTKPRVLLYAGLYGRRTEVWIHRHATGLKRYECHIAAAGYVNRGLFPHPAVHLVDSEKMFLHRLLQLGHLLRRREWPTGDRVKTVGMRGLVSRVEPALIHVHFLWNLPVAAPVAEEFGLPLVVTAHGTDVNSAVARPRYRRDVLAGLERTTRVIAISDFIAGRLRQIGCPPEKVRRLYLGAPMPPVRANPASRHGLMRVLCVAALKEAKGHRYLLEAFARALREDPRLRLVLAGEGRRRAAIQQQMRQLGIEQKVELAGHIPPTAVGELMASSHIYVQHSLRHSLKLHDGQPVVQEEGLPVSLVEAASFGLPMVATRCGGQGEICRHGETGYLVDQRDVEGTADRILELARSPELAGRMGANARALAEREFDADVQLAQIERLYDEVIQAKTG
ncbi:MAG: glycosyltransferase [Planctomycetota bacterium]